MLEDHPMGEDKFEPASLVQAVQSATTVHPPPSGDLRVATPGGVFQVRWDANASASALGQLAFFGEFLEVSGLFQRWVESLPARNGASAAKNAQKANASASRPNWTRAPYGWTPRYLRAPLMFNRASLVGFGVRLRMVGASRGWRVTMSYMSLRAFRRPTSSLAASSRVNTVGPDPLG